MKKINVLYQSSADYAIPAAVSIYSLLENNRKLDEINIWFIDAGLTDMDRKKIEHIVNTYGRKITFLSGESLNQMLSEADVGLWNESYATFYKIFIGGQLTCIDRILYIDSDTLILNSLEELCDYEMDGYACAMAGSGMTNVIKSYIGIQEWFNAGVIYFNLDYWRANDVEQDFIRLIKGTDCLKYTIVGDESLDNYVMRGKIKKLPLKYNFESSWWLWGWNHKLYGKLGWETEGCYYSDDEIKAAKNAPCIAHYVDLTTGRPWDYLNDNPFQREFEQYLSLVKPWKNIDFAMRGIGGNNKLVQWMKYIVKKMLPFSLRSRIGFYQHDRVWRKKVMQVRGQLE